MSRTLTFLLISLGVGVFLWVQRDNFSAPHHLAPVPKDAEYVIRRKVKPGGYIGWHESEIDPMTNAVRQTRQASNYYLICTEKGSWKERIFVVPRNVYMAERVGSVLPGSRMRSFQEVHRIEEPSLPDNFEFRRREPEFGGN